MNDERIAKKICEGKVSGKRSRERRPYTFENNLKNTGLRLHLKQEDVTERGGLSMKR